MLGLVALTMLIIWGLPKLTNFTDRSFLALRLPLTKNSMLRMILKKSSSTSKKAESPT
jgi:hypothetical protein